MWYLQLAERGQLPDPLVRGFIRCLNWNKIRELSAGGPERQQQRATELVEELAASSIAEDTEAANQQHYELPARFFELVLGRHRKYSSAYWPKGTGSLDQAEEAMLALYLQRASLQDGQRILELGCGWGSLTLYLASHFPNSEILAVSNSHSQREYLQPRIPPNVTVLTCDINQFEPETTFDRIVSIEMFEHIRNYPTLFPRLDEWLKPEGLVFLHVFCHRLYPYLFEVRSEADWIERYFFTGGTMPSATLLPSLCWPLRPVQTWLVDGTHYQKTANAWLANLDSQEQQVQPILAEVYPDPKRWWVYWRLFFLACAELFGYDGGRQWMVAHHLFQKSK